MNATIGAEPFGGRWQAESLRATAFFSRAPAASVDQLWPLLVEEEPDLVTAAPRAGTKQLEGPFRHGRLTLVGQVARTDVLYVAQNTLQSTLENETSLSVGSLAEALEVFLPVALKFVAALGPLTRIAFGAVLSQDATDKVDGYRRLASYLPCLKLDPENSSDFSYQINRARASELDILGLRLNRFSKWSVSSRYQALVALSVPAAAMATSQLALLNIGPHVEIDVNTAPDFASEFEPDVTAKVVRELQGLLVEIAEKGDLP